MPMDRAVPMMTRDAAEKPQHNNHHKHGSSPNFGGFRWHEIDPTYIIILILDKIGAIKLKPQMAVAEDMVKKAA